MLKWIRAVDLNLLKTEKKSENLYEWKEELLLTKHGILEYTDQKLGNAVRFDITANIQ